MQLDIRFSGVKRTHAWDSRFEDVLLCSLEKFRHRVKQICLYIEDVNGPKRGVDKQCRCVLHLRRMPPVVIQDQDESLVSLIYRIANRASYSLSQKTDRRNSRRVARNRNIEQSSLEVEVDETVTEAVAWVGR